jgi:CRP-like cAMP-binding protein
VKERVANTLVGLLRKQRPGATVLIRREDLAGIAGTTVESAVRCLTELKRQGLIQISGREIKVTDRKGLEAISGSSG